VLVFKRKAGQAISIGGNVRIVVVVVERDHVKLAVEAPRDVDVHREEIQKKIQHAKEETP